MIIAFKTNNSIPQRKGVTKITKRTAASYVAKCFDLDNNERAQEITDPGTGDIHILIPARDYSRTEVEMRLSEYFANKAVMGGRCRIEGMEAWVIVHIEDKPKGGAK